MLLSGFPCGGGATVNAPIVSGIVDADVVVASGDILGVSLIGSSDLIGKVPPVTGDANQRIPYDTIVCKLRTDAYLMVNRNNGGSPKVYSILMQDGIATVGIPTVLPNGFYTRLGIARIDDNTAILCGDTNGANQGNCAAVGLYLEEDGSVTVGTVVAYGTGNGQSICSLGNRRALLLAGSFAVYQITITGKTTISSIGGGLALDSSKATGMHNVGIVTTYINEAANQYYAVVYSTYIISSTYTATLIRVSVSNNSIQKGTTWTSPAYNTRAIHDVRASGDDLLVLTDGVPSGNNHAALLKIDNNNVLVSRLQLSTNIINNSRRMIAPLSNSRVICFLATDTSEDLKAIGVHSLPAGLFKGPVVNLGNTYTTAASLTVAPMDNMRTLLTFPRRETGEYIDICIVRLDNLLASWGTSDTWVVPAVAKGAGESGDTIEVFVPQIITI